MDEIEYIRNVLQEKGLVLSSRIIEEKYLKKEMLDDRSIGSREFLIADTLNYIFVSNSMMYEAVLDEKGTISIKALP